MNLAEIIDGIYLLPEESKSMFKGSVMEVKPSKGAILLQASRVETSICSIKKRIARAYARRGENEVTFWFGKLRQEISMPGPKANIGDKGKSSRN
ncbi:hypothetical protein [Rufibacter latericius]|uniref:Uncharacterized protein n=1 Tax=Rufibacter latericius TaxID=2487040 RepID=A0A3M9MQ63_9BACT|nr:hypothetical protein [Rufibacter latericius]RNI26838.1 hypothetical protein EFB08_10170 [Rufibacter latericius]